MWCTHSYLLFINGIAYLYWNGVLKPVSLYWILDNDSVCMIGIYNDIQKGQQMYETFCIYVRYN